MSISVNKLININAAAIFFFAVATQIFPAINFMNAQNVSYLTYLAPIALIFCLIVSLIKFYSDHQIIIDNILIFLIYYLLNCLFLVELDFLNNTGHVRFIAIPVLFICFYIIFKNIQNVDIFHNILKGLVLIAIIQSIIGLTQVFFGFPVFENILKSEELYDNERNYLAYIFPFLFSKYHLQASGTFPHFNALGAFLVICIPIAYVLWRQEKKVIWLVSFFVLWAAVIATFSRGSLVGASLATAVVYFSFTKMKLVKILLSILVILLVFIVISPIIETYNQQTSNFGGRYETWVYSLNYALNRPENLIFGYGYSNVRFILDAQREVYTNFHSTYIQMFVELGIIGCILFLIGIFFLFRNLFAQKTSWSFCLMAIVIGFLFTQIFEQHLWGFHGLLFFTLIGLFQANLSNE